MTTRPGPSPGARAGIPAPRPLRSLASPASQGLVAVAFAVTAGALADQLGNPLWFAALTGALLLGVVLGLQLDLRRVLETVPGVVLGLTTLVILSALWAVVLSTMAVELPYELVPLAALVAFGTDWWWVERLRPATVASGIGLVPLLGDDVAAALPFAVVWFAVAAAALWSLRGDTDRAIPTPVPLAGPSGAAPETGAGRTAAAVVASWLLAVALVAGGSLLPGLFRSPELDGGLGGAPSAVGPGSGGGGNSGPGGTIDPGGLEGDLDGDGIRDDMQDAPSRDVDGDGIPDRDIDGDGIPDVDLDGDGIPDIDRDGDGVPDDPSRGASTIPDPDGVLGPDETGLPADDANGRVTILRVVGIGLAVLLAAALIALVVRALARGRDRRQALAARPWPIRLAERLEREGARRGRSRRRDEPVTRYADVLAGDVLAHDLLAEVGTALSAALFGAAPPADATGAWAAQIVDEAVEANPAPGRLDAVRDRLRRRRADGPAEPA